MVHTFYSIYIANPFYSIYIANPIWFTCHSDKFKLIVTKHYMFASHLSVITASPLTTPLSIFQVGTHFFVHTGHGEKCLMHSSINGSEIWCLFKATLPCIQCWSHGQDSNWRHLSSATQDVEDQCYGFCGLMALLWLSSGVQDFFVSGLSLVCVHTICHLESGWVSQLWCLTNV